MRIYNQKKDESIDNITLLLTLSEANELSDALNQLIESSNTNEHHHVNDDNYKHEITISIYNENKNDILFSDYSERIKSLILNDE